MKLYVVRHGETNLNKNKILQGHYNEALNEEGINLAKISGQNLKGIKFDEAFSSPLSRSLDTIRIILKESGNKETNITIDNRLEEIDIGDWTLKDLKDESYFDYENMKKFFKDPFSISSCPNGESIYDVIKRTQDFLLELAKRNDNKTYLVGTHGIAMRSMLNMFYEDKNNFWHTHVPYNCSFNIIEVKDNNIKLVEEDVCFYNLPKQDFYK